MNNNHLDIFSKRAKQYNQEFHWINDPKFINILVPEVFGDKTFLDLCSGSGAIARCACSLGWKVTAIDNNDEMMNTNDVNCTKIISDIHKLPFSHNSFDVVACRQGLQYTLLNDALQEIKRVVKSSVYLAHITIYDKDDVDFWRAYYAIAAPNRRNVFIPNQIVSAAVGVGLKHEYTDIMFTEESLLSPTEYLSYTDREKLIKMLKEKDKSFLLRNNISIGNSDIRSVRRWEVSCFHKN